MNKEKIKEHIKEHLVEYALGVATVAAGITYLVMRGQCSGLQRGPEDATTKLQRGLDTMVSASIRPFNFFSTNNNHVVQVVEREGRGHPGYLIEKLGSKERFLSQHELAKTLGVSDSIVSGHLKGKIPDILGEQYVRVGVRYLD